MVRKNGEKIFGGKRKRLYLCTRFREASPKESKRTLNIVNNRTKICEVQKQGLTLQHFRPTETPTQKKAKKRTLKDLQ